MLRPHRPLCLALLLLSAPTWIAQAAGATPCGSEVPPQRSEAREQELSQTVALGRAALAAGDLEAARRAFEQAAQIDRAGAESSFWLQRLEIAEGNHEAVLTKLSRLKREGKLGADGAYLQALALEALAREQAQRGGSGAQLMFEDAFGALEPISQAASERYGDVHLPLARTARQLGRLEASEAAARRALAIDSKSYEAYGLLGRALLGRLAAMPADESTAEARPQLYGATKEAFEGGLKALGEPGQNAAALSAAADLCNQLGTAHAYGLDQAAAGEAYARAIGYDPGMVDFGAIRAALGDKGFAAACEQGSRTFVERAGTKDARDATIQWWRGFALFNLNQPEDRAAARSAFETALAKYPVYLNSLYYLARLCYDDQQYDAAIGHVADYWQRAPEGLTQLLGDDTDILRLEFLIAKAMKTPRHDQAILLSRVLCQARPQNGRFWNNLGLFLRDDGDIRMSKLKPEQAEERAEVMTQWEDSLTAYEQALALEPKNPAYLNDTAVILHYNLQRDFERALSLYAEATAEANRLLEAGGLDAETKQLFEIALRDSKDNRKKLESRLTKEKKESEAK